jgi:hypothetical protein
MRKLYKTMGALGLGLAWALGAGSSFAATTVEVGRVKLALNEDSWVVSEELPYNKEVSSASGTIQGKAKVLTLRNANSQVQAAMYVGATFGKSRVYTQGSKCGENPGLYVRDFNGPKVENFRCVFVGGPFETESLQKNVVQELQKASQTLGAPAVASKTAYFVIVHMTANGGVIIRAEGLFAPEFMGLPDGKPVAEVPGGLSPAVAAWADQLAESALDALTSFRGGLPVPKVEFSSAQK